MTFIDPPSPFAPRQDWEAFLAEISKVSPRTAEIETSMALAREVIAGVGGQEDAGPGAPKKLADYLARIDSPSGRSKT